MIISKYVSGRFIIKLLSVIVRIFIMYGSLWSTAVESEFRLINLTRPGGRKFGEFLVRIFAHQADQVIILQNLQTGLADDITGKLRIVRPKGRLLQKRPIFIFQSGPSGPKHDS